LLLIPPAVRGALAILSSALQSASITALVVTQCDFVNNTALSGGAIRVTETPATILDSTFVGNRALATTSAAGGARLQAVRALCVNLCRAVLQVAPSTRWAPPR
jgi:hypothetical protein